MIVSRIKKWAVALVLIASSAALLRAENISISTLFSPVYWSGIPGADPSGTADSTTALTNFLANNSDAYIPAGTYSVCNLQAPGTGPQVIHGAGGATKLIAGAGCNLPVMEINCSGGVYQQTVYDLIIDGNGNSQTQGGSVPAHGLYIVSCPLVFVHHNRFQNVAGHGFFVSNPSSPGTLYSGQVVDGNSFYNIGNAPLGTYGSALDITHGVNTKLSSNDCNTTAKACYRIESGAGIHLANDTAQNFGNGGVVPVSGVSSDITITGGFYSNGTLYSSSTITGNTHGTTTINSLSTNVIAAGWQVGMEIGSSGSDIPASTTITAIAAGGLSVTLSQAATGSNAGDTFTVDNTNISDAIDGIRLIGVPRVAISGVVAEGNPGNGISFANGASNGTVTGSIVRNNGNSTASVSSTGGRSGIKIFNSGSVVNDVAVSGNQLYDDQGGSATQLYGVEVANSSDKVVIAGNDFGSGKNGQIGISSSGTDILVANSNRGLTSQNLNTATTTLTGSTAETSLASFTINAAEISKTAVLRCRANGTVSGTSGTKTVKLYVGGVLGDGSGIQALSESAAGVSNWGFDSLISWNASQASEKVSTLATSTSAGATTSSVANNFANSQAIMVTGTLGSGSDSLVISQLYCERVK